MERPIADNPLAKWLAMRMADWEDPLTKVRGLSTNRAAELTGVSQTMLWEIVKVEGTVPRPDVLARIADFFEVSSLVLFELAYIDSDELEGLTATERAQATELFHIIAELPMKRRREFSEALLAHAKYLRGIIETENERED